MLVPQPPRLFDQAAQRSARMFRLTVRRGSFVFARDIASTVSICNRRHHYGASDWANIWPLGEVQIPGSTGPGLNPA